MPIQIGAQPDSGFEDPIGMLIDCHRRIEHFLNIFHIVLRRAWGKALCGEERAAVEAALKYFHQGGERHIADEEISLFPRLKQLADESALSDLLRLENDHHVAGHIHRTIEVHYRKWILAGLLHEDESRELLYSTEQLKCLYSAHIEMEEQIIFPHARRELNGSVLHMIGQEFRERRQQQPE